MQYSSAPIKEYGLFEFVGDTLVNWSDRKLLRQVVKIYVSGYMRDTLHDGNMGNFLVRNDKVYYIDKTLNHIDRDPTTLTDNTRPKFLIEIITYSLMSYYCHKATQKVYVDLLLDYIDMFKESLKKSGESFSKDEIEGTDDYIKDAWKDKLSKISPTDKERVYSALKSLIESLVTK